MGISDRRPQGRDQLNSRKDAQMQWKEIGGDRGPLFKPRYAHNKPTLTWEPVGFEWQGKG